jgi:hypothetical protein
VVAATVTVCTHPRAVTAAAPQAVHQNLHGGIGTGAAERKQAQQQQHQQHQQLRTAPQLASPTAESQAKEAVLWDRRCRQPKSACTS